MNKLNERLREERERLGLSQDDMAKVGGIGRTTQLNYEAGTRFPDTDYLHKIAGAGANQIYILTGERVAGSVLPKDENVLLKHYRSLSKNKKEALRVVASGLIDDDVKREKMMSDSHKNRLFPKINVALSGVSDEWYVMAFNVEQTLLDAGAVPDRDYTYLDVMKLAQPLVMERWRLNGKMEFEVPKSE